MNTPTGKGNQTEKIIHLLEEQLAHANEQNKALSQKLNQALDRIKFLNQQLQQLTKLLYPAFPNCVTRMSVKLDINGFSPCYKYSL